MPARERLNKYEQILAYIMGGGIVIAIIGLILGGIGVIDSGRDVGTFVLIGMIVLIVAGAAWLYFQKPWKNFDDLKTPQYTGHEEPAPLTPVQETAADVNFGEAVPGTERSASVSLVSDGEPSALSTVADAKPPAVVEVQPKAIVDTEPPRERKSTEAPAIPMPSPIVSPDPIELPAPAAESASPVISDDLTLIEGIGPKVAAALSDAGVTTFAQVAAMSPEELEALVRERNVRLVGRTTTWPIQARSLQQGDLSAFEDVKRRVRQDVLRDELTTLEGIGPKIQTVLYDAGIYTFAQLAQATPDDLKVILVNAGLRIANPASWPEQAALVVKQDFTGLKAMQDQLRGGHKKKSE